jgi:hypothetical protein
VTQVPANLFAAPPVNTIDPLTPGARQSLQNIGSAAQADADRNNRAAIASLQAGVEREAIKSREKLSKLQLDADRISQQIQTELAYKELDQREQIAAQDAALQQEQIQVQKDRNTQLAADSKEQRALTKEQIELQKGQQVFSQQMASLTQERNNALDDRAYAAQRESAEASAAAAERQKQISRELAKNVVAAETFNTVVEEGPAEAIAYLTQAESLMEARARAEEKADKSISKAVENVFSDAVETGVKRTSGPVRGTLAWLSDTFKIEKWFGDGGLPENPDFMRPGVSYREPSGSQADLILNGDVNSPDLADMELFDMGGLVEASLGELDRAGVPIPPKVGDLLKDYMDTVYDLEYNRVGTRGQSFDKDEVVEIERISGELKQEIMSIPGGAAALRVMGQVSTRLGDRLSESEGASALSDLGRVWTSMGSELVGETLSASEQLEVLSSIRERAVAAIATQDVADDQFVMQQFQNTLGSFEEAGQPVPPAYEKAFESYLEKLGEVQGARRGLRENEAQRMALEAEQEEARLDLLSEIEGGRLEVFEEFAPRIEDINDRIGDIISFEPEEEDEE